MYALVMKARAAIAHHPRFAIWLAGIIVRIRPLRDHLARRYNILLPALQPAGEAPPGYRLPLGADAAALCPAARDILRELG